LFYYTPADIIFETHPANTRNSALYKRSRQENKIIFGEILTRNVVVRLLLGKAWER